MWMVTYSYGGWGGIVRTCDRDTAIATADRLASEGKSDITVYRPDERIEASDPAKDKEKPRR